MFKGFGQQKILRGIIVKKVSLGNMKFYKSRGKED